MLNNNTFSTQFPLYAVISHLRNTSQSPLSTVLLIDLLLNCQILALSWHVCSLPLSLCVCVLCERGHVQICPPTWNGTRQIPQSLPKGPLHGLRPRRARSPRSGPGQLTRTLQSRCTSAPTANSPTRTWIVSECTWWHSTLSSPCSAVHYARTCSTTRSTCSSTSHTSTVWRLTVLISLLPQ